MKFKVKPTNINFLKSIQHIDSTHLIDIPKGITALTVNKNKEGRGDPRDAPDLRK